jgi:DNA-binding response OmpR family regulator
MAPQTDPRASVLIVDADAAIRRLLGAVLEHAGFRTVAADDLDDAAALLETATFAVILRDLNLAPAESGRSLQQLTATAPELLRRTIVMTTAAARAETAVRAGSVFAIVSKPFDVENLVSVVRACARSSREADRRGTWRTASSRQPGSEPEPEVPVVKLESLQRFARSVPSLERLLSVPVTCQREAALRAEMRRTLGALAATLTEAAHAEASRTRASVFRAASTMATRLATVPAPESAIAARGRDH